MSTTTSKESLRNWEEFSEDGKLLSAPIELLSEVEFLSPLFGFTYGIVTHNSIIQKLFIS